MHLFRQVEAVGLSAVSLASAIHQNIWGLLSIDRIINMLIVELVRFINRQDL